LSFEKSRGQRVKGFLGGASRHENMCDFVHCCRARCTIDDDQILRNFPLNVANNEILPLVD
jgi:hypothetical protein